MPLYSNNFLRIHGSCIILGNFLNFEGLHRYNFGFGLHLLLTNFISTRHKRLCCFLKLVVVKEIFSKHYFVLAVDGDVVFRQCHNIAIILVLLFLRIGFTERVRDSLWSL